METMRDIRGRIRSIHQSLQITQAMKLISSAKLRRSRQRLDEVSPYFSGIRNALKDLVDGARLERGPWFNLRKEKIERKTATIVVTADRGLAGGYNSTVIHHVESVCPARSILVPVGTVGKRYFMDKDYLLLEDFPASAKEPSVFEARDIANLVSELFLSGRVDEVRIVYTKFVSAAKQEVDMIRLLPLDAAHFENSAGPGSLAERAARRNKVSVRYEAHPSEELLIGCLVNKYLKGVIFGTFVESFASEQASRMAAMDSASRNARDMLDAFQLLYNRARQSAITAEVSEIVSGAASRG